ncbi:DUF4144 family protein [Vibrio mexicanus]|uniref:DUF4144 family protein n=1 Tax=Vibrio mexicanus TaxID=1004326 RepID=UPI00063C5AB3|nr:DUF4144 family protein [Vibrio mexicanus]
MIQWPCLFKLEGDDELIFLSSELELIKELQALIWSEEDLLIDSCGNQYQVVNVSASVQYQLLSVKLSLQQVTELIQAHEFSKAEICITKIQFPDVTSAIEALRPA